MNVGPGAGTRPQLMLPPWFATKVLRWPRPSPVPPVDLDLALSTRKKKTFETPLLILGTADTPVSDPD